MKESSRVIVKNIPKAITDAQLKDHFIKRGFQVTDCRIQKTQNGQSRNFAFVGFKSEEQAGDVIKQFNGTFILSTKVTIEYAQAKNSEDIGRAWSKYTEGSSAFKRSNPEDKKPKKSEEEEAKAAEKKKKSIDSKLEEFLGVTLKKKGARVWANDEVANEEETRQRDQKLATEKGQAKAREMAELGIPKKQKERKQKGEESEDEELLSEDEEGQNDVVMGGDDMETAGLKTLNFDSDEEDSKPKKTAAKPAKKEESDSESEVEEEEDNEETPSAPPTNPLQIAGETGRLRILNLPYSATADELKAHFTKTFGPVEEAHVSKHEVSGKSRGFGFIQFIFPEHAVRALEKVFSAEGVVFQGRKVKLEAAEEKKSSKVEGVKAVGGVPLREKQEATSSYKRQQELKKKQQAGNVKSWNLLYVSANGVADAVAAQLGVEKSDLLDLDSEGLAVRVALGEAQLLRDTKEWLKKEGIRVDAFERRGASLHAASEFAGENDANKSRASDTLILKHLPPKVTDEDLRHLIAPCGAYSRLCVAPSRTVAVVQFAEAQRAKNAFYALAFKKFLGVPLYVEWAPVDLFITGSAPTPASAPAAAAPAAAAKPAETPKAAEASAEAAAADLDSAEKEASLEDAATVSLFVKNLNFRTSESAFKNFFARSKGFKTAKLMTKAAPVGSNLPVDVLSLGYGFIEFDTLQSAKDCMKMLQGAALDGHSLELSIAANRNAANQRAAEKTTVANTGAAGNTASKVDSSRVGTRLLVKNLAFQANKRDVQKLFTPYGTVSSVRLPKKADGTCRGFGFVEMASRADAKHALEMLQHAHLYGRHLVIEPAKEEEAADDADTVQQRASEQLNKSAGDGPQNESRKRRKLAKLDNVDGGSMESMMDL